MRAGGRRIRGVVSFTLGVLAFGTAVALVVDDVRGDPPELVRVAVDVTLPQQPLPAPPTVAVTELPTTTVVPRQDLPAPTTTRPPATLAPEPAPVITAPRQQPAPRVATPAAVPTPAAPVEPDAVVVVAAEPPAPSTEPATTVAPTTVAPTTVAPTTVAPTTVAPTTVAPTTVAPTTTDCVRRRNGRCRNNNNDD